MLNVEEVHDIFRKLGKMEYLHQKMKRSRFQEYNKEKEK